MKCARGISVLLGAVLTGACASSGADPIWTPQPAPAAVTGLLTGWPEKSQEVANTMIAKYGTPHEATATMLVWHDLGPWNRTVVYREPVQHDFPVPHEDLLEQFIDYQVPIDRFDELAAYDGSVIAERTKGVMSARCDKEEMNFLALNLAHEIITGNKSVEEARDAYAHTVKQVMKGEKPEYTTKLAFQPQPQAGDTDVAVLQPQPGQPGEAQPAAEQQPAQREQREQPAPQR